MLAELAIANAAFQVIKTTLSNGKELADAGKAVGDYFGAEKAINVKAADGGGDNVLEIFQAKKQLEKQEEELKFMLNKQSLLGYHEFQMFKAQYTRDLRDAEKAKVRQRHQRQQAMQETASLGIKVMGIMLIIMAALFGVALYVKGI